ncbi:MAG: hypothetical protein LBT30_00990 [Clostridiales bacterium]|jgi:hypothetical protein|nr:hypothetical protein [Clostridiales bacterium]
MSGSSLQPAEFLIFAAAGFVCALIYAVFWLCRHFVKKDGFWEMLSDFTFVIVSGAIFLFCLTQKSDGTLKFFYFFAFLLTLSTILLTLSIFKEILIAFFKGLYSRLKKSAPIVFVSDKIKALSLKSAAREQKRFISAELYRLAKIKKRQEKADEKIAAKAAVIAQRKTKRDKKAALKQAAKISEQKSRLLKEKQRSDKRRQKSVNATVTDK